MSRRYSGLSLSRQGTAHTVLLRMAEDQDRAARIAELKKCHPRLTWAKIAEETGVKERSAIKWQKTGALKPENAEALARLFGVDFDYIWTGPRPETPDMFVDRRNRPAGPIAVNRVEGDLAEWLASIEDRLNTVAAAEPSQLADESVAEAGRALRAAPPSPRRAAAKPARTRTPGASGQDPA
jgi:hypothetical protein